MALKGIEVVSVPVADQDRAKSFYLDKLGFTEVVDARVDETMRWVQLAPPGGGTTITLMNWSADEMPPSSLKELYLECDDIDKEVEGLRAGGVTITRGIDDTPFGKFARFDDADGNGWVLHEQPAGR